MSQKKYLELLVPAYCTRDNRWELEYLYGSKAPVLRMRHSDYSSRFIVQVMTTPSGYIGLFGYSPTGESLGRLDVDPSVASAMRDMVNRKFYSLKEKQVEQANVAMHLAQMQAQAQMQAAEGLRARKAFEESESKSKYIPPKLMRKFNLLRKKKVPLKERLQSIGDKAVGIMVKLFGESK